MDDEERSSPVSAPAALVGMKANRPGGNNGQITRPGSPTSGR